MMTLPNIVLYSIVYSTVQYTVLNDMHTECISSFIYPKMYKNKSALNHMGPKPWSAESESCTLSIHLTTSLLQGLCLCGLGVTGLSGESSQITFLPCVIKDSWGMVHMCCVWQVDACEAAHIQTISINLHATKTHSSFFYGNNMINMSWFVRMSDWMDGDCCWTGHYVTIRPTFARFVWNIDTMSYLIIQNKLGELSST